MTRVLLIHAGPTKWDEENRLTGAHSLPLTDDAALAAKGLVEAVARPPTGLYLCRDNEACEQVGKMIAEKFNLRLRDRPELQELKLGLWEGLTRDELRRRIPTVVKQWHDDPLRVQPPQGESIPQAIERVRPAVRKIVRRNPDGVVAIVVRPYVMQIVRGLLLNEPPSVIASHLQNVDMMETIEVDG